LLADRTSTDQDDPGQSKSRSAARRKNGDAWQKRIEEKPAEEKKAKRKEPEAREKQKEPTPKPEEPVIEEKETIAAPAEEPKPKKRKWFGRKSAEPEK
jgi:hypothetical protein